jgi:hypothetical protein
MTVTTERRITTWSDVRRLIGTTRASAILDQKLGMADPTNMSELDRLVVELRQIGVDNATRNTVLQLQYEILRQREANTVAAMGRMGPAAPETSTNGPTLHGGALDTAARDSSNPGRLRAMASSGELRKIIDGVEPVMKADGSGIDETATAVRMTMQAGALPGRLSPDGRRLK